eukprot:1204436-Amphidinium_carterae.1
MAIAATSWGSVAYGKPQQQITSARCDYRQCDVEQTHEDSNSSVGAKHTDQPDGPTSFRRGQPCM